MALMRVLIAVKTYPTLSEKYDELVCTAGFLEDGSWIRIYPVPFRKLDYENQYHKWQWLEIDLIKNQSDFRPESYRPRDIESLFIMGEAIDTSNKWAVRRSIVMTKVHMNMSELIAEAKDIGTSLAVLKPTKIIDLIWEPCDREWNVKRLTAIEANKMQLSLFEKDAAKRLFKIVRKLPYKFSYIFTTKDGLERTLMIEDWELGQLYWNCLKTANNNENIACQKVREKYFSYMVDNCDLHFFLGTTRQYHKIAPNPFIIVGTFYPPKTTISQPTLFD